MKRKVILLLFLNVIAGLAWNASASNRQEIDSLVKQLGDEALHYDTLRRLAQIGKPAVPELVRVLPQADHELAVTIVETLGLMGRDAEGAVPALIAALRQPNFFVQGHPIRSIFNWKCVLTLAEIGAPAIPALVETLSDANADIRYYAAEALSYMGYEARPAALALVPLLNDEYDKVRAMAASALGKMKSRPLEDITVIFDSMDMDPTLEKRIQADDEMLAKAAQAAIPDLMPMLEDENYSIRAAAVHALGTLGGAVAVPALTAALKDRHDKVREAAATALGEIGHPAKAAVPALIHILKKGPYEAQGVRVSAVQGLGGIGTPAAASGLIEALNDQSSFIRRMVIVALASIGEPVDTIVPPLMQMLADSDSEVCFESSQALGRIGEPAVPALIEGLSHENKVVREWSASTLLRIGPSAEAAVSALKQAFSDDKDARVREIAAYALKAIELFEFTPPKKVKIPKRAR